MSGKDVQRRLRLFAAGVPCVVAVLIVALIIPLVATDTFRGGNPRGSSIAFGVNAIMHALLAYLAFRSNRSSGSISVWLGAFALALGIILLDPAFAFTAHPGLHVAVTAMFFCAFSDVVAAVLVFAMAFTRSRAEARPVRLFE